MSVAPLPAMSATFYPASTSAVPHSHTWNQILRHPSPIYFVAYAWHCSTGTACPYFCIPTNPSASLSHKYRAKRGLVTWLSLREAGHYTRGNTVDFVMAPWWRVALFSSSSSSHRRDRLCRNIGGWPLPGSRVLDPCLIRLGRRDQIPSLIRTDVPQHYPEESRHREGGCRGGYRHGNLTIPNPLLISYR